MPVVIRSLYQARCDNRSVATASSPDPIAWIRAALSSSAQTLSFHFFVNWAKTPPCLTGPLWHTRLAAADDPILLHSLSDSDVKTALMASGETAPLHELDGFARSIGMTAEGVLLGEPSKGRLVDDSPSWIVRLPDQPQEQPLVSRVKLSELGALINSNRGGRANLGSKGLTYGTSAVECYLSHTANIFPGDCDCLVVQDGRPCILFEMKKHTLAGPIEENLASRYYPRQDGRKYDALFALQTRIQASTAVPVPLAVVYYATKAPQMRVQIIERNGGSLRTCVDSGDLSTEDLTPSQLGQLVLQAVDL